MAETPLQIVRGKSVDEILRRAGIIPALPGSTNKALLEGSASAPVVELKFSSLPIKFGWAGIILSSKCSTRSARMASPSCCAIAQGSRTEVLTLPIKFGWAGIRR